jgi:3'-5' exonuclease
MTELLFIDTESEWDEHLHEEYRSIDPVGAGEHERGGAKRHRHATRRIYAAAALHLSISNDGKVQPLGVRVWTEEDRGDEKGVIEALFQFLQTRPQAKVVTYSGLAADVPLINLAAMQHELVLPPQLRAEFRARSGTLRPHTDLALVLKGQGRQWAHLSEIGLRLGFPAELFACKPKVGKPRSQKEWEGLGCHVALDTVLTAMVALSWWRAQGVFDIDQTAMVYQLCDWSMRRRIVGEAQALPVARLAEQMLERMDAEVTEAS